MKIISDIDYSTLNWVKEELDDTLEQAGQALEAYTEDTADTTQLRFCATYLHQVLGILQMLELYGAAMLAEEMENVARALLNEETPKPEDAYEILMRAILQLSDYLERIQGGYRDVPILILPLLNDLRAVRGENLLTENSFFKPNLDLAGDQPNMERDESVDAMDQLAKKLRHAFQIGLLGVIRNKDEKKSLKSLLLVMDKLAESAQSEKSRLLWWIGGGLIEALYDETLESSTSVKMLLGQIDRQLKAVIENGEQYLIDQAPQDLLKNLLYYVGRSNSESEKVKAIQDKFGLKHLIPDDDELSRAREGISGPTSQMLSTVSEAVKEDLATVKDGLDLFIRGNQTDLSKLSPLAEVLSRVADTIGMIGLGASRNVLKEKASVLVEIVSGNTEVSESILMDAAGALLYVESALDELVRRPLVRESAEEAAHEAATDAQDDAEFLEKELFRFEYEQVFVAAINEAVADIGIIKDKVMAFIDSQNHDDLDEVPQIFSRLTGALKVLGLDRASALLDLAGQYLSQELLFNRAIPKSIDLDILADAITSVEYYLEGYIDRTGAREGILDVAQQSVRILGYPLDTELESKAVSEQESSTIEVEVPDSTSFAEEMLEADDIGLELVDFEPEAGAEELESIEFDTLSDEFNETEEIGTEITVESDGFVDIVADTSEESIVDASAEEAFAEAKPLPKESINPADLAVLKEDYDPEILDIFMEEADEIMDELRQSIPAWLANNEDSAQLQEIRRSFHTFKGSGRLAGAQLLGEFAWHIERMLNQVIDNLISADETVNSVMRQAFDTLPELIEQVKGGAEPKADLRYLFWKTDVLAHPNRHAELEAGPPWLAEAVALEEAIEEPVEEALEEVVAEEVAEEPAEEAVEEVVAEEVAEEPAEEAVEEVVAEEVIEELVEEAPEELIAEEVVAEEVAEEPAEEAVEEVVAEEVAEEPAEEALEELVAEEVAEEPAEEILEELVEETVEEIAAEPVEETVEEVSEETAEDVYEEDLEEESDELITAESTKVEGQAEEEIPPMDPALYEIFSKEVGDHIQTVEAFNELAHDVKHRFVTQDLLRALHTLAGSARMAQAAKIASIAGLLEHYAQEHVNRQMALEEDDLERLSKGMAYIREDLAAHGDPSISPPPSEPFESELARLIEEYESTSVPADGVDQPYSEDEDFDLIDLFIEEATDILEFLETTLQRIENDIQDQGALTELHRSLHTLKGGARLAGFTGIGTLSHALEAIANDIASGKIEASDSFFETLHIAFDRLSDMVEQAKQGKSLLAPDEVLKMLSEISGGDELIEGGIAEREEEQDMELVEIFLDEGDEILAATNDILQRWIDEPDNGDLITEMQRALHTLKGGARMAGFWSIGNLGHVLETLLIDVLESRVPAGENFFDLLEAIQIRLEDMLNLAKNGQKIEEAAELLEAIEKLRSGEEVSVEIGAPEPKPKAPAKGKEQGKAKGKKAKAEAEPVTGEVVEEKAAPVHHEMVRVRADLLDNLVNYAGEVSLYRARTEQQVNAIGSNLDEMDQTVVRLRDQLRTLEIETEAQILFRYERESEEDEKGEFDPLELDRFSTLQQLSRALSESVNDLLNIGSSLEHMTRDAETLLLQQSRVNTELQEGLMRSRMVPFANLVPRMRRIVRQTCQEMGKKAQLKVTGAQGEMDRTVLERVIAPLEHMLRNGIAHGIETPQERSAADKEESGTINITVSREGPEVVIRVEDDGAGINHDAIREKARKLGMMREDADLSDTEVVQFILETGFSTAEEVSQIAGRGVGMDVVNNEIKQLGGTLHILSERGRGTEFTIRLPFTLAVNHVLMTQVLDEVYAIPLSSIDGVVRMSHEQLLRCFKNPDESYYDYAGQRYQVVSMTQLLGICAPVLPGEGKRSPIILVQAGESRLALQVDALMGNREIVVKAVGPQVSSIPGLMGATILGNGRVVLILDVGALIRVSVSGEIEAAPLEAHAEEKVKRFTVMVVDDSITMRKVTARLLERSGFDSVTAKDGVDAITVLQDVHPDLMLLDIEMPRMDGFELATHMRNDESLSDIPIIMITSRTGDKHRERAMKIGVNDYMGKPYVESELLGNIQKLLGIKNEYH